MAKKKNKSGNSLGLALLLFVAGGGIAVFLYLKLPAWLDNSVRGIDVSHHNGEINWNKVRRDRVSFAFIKATEGLTLVDEDFETNWTSSAENKILRGAYHFFLPSLDGKEQARHFLSRVSLQPGDLPPVLDLEVTSGQKASVIARRALDWMQEVEKVTGVKPILYTLPRFADDYLRQKLTGYPLWVVDLHAAEPSLPGGWDTWTFWQYSHTGKIPGIKGKVDLNYFNGSVEELRKLGRK